MLVGRKLKFPDQFHQQITVEEQIAGNVQPVKLARLVALQFKMQGRKRTHDDVAFKAQDVRAVTRPQISLEKDGAGPSEIPCAGYFAKEHRVAVGGGANFRTVVNDVVVKGGGRATRSDDLSAGDVVYIAKDFAGSSAERHDSFVGPTAIGDELANEDGTIEFVNLRRHILDQNYRELGADVVWVGSVPANATAIKVRWRTETGQAATMGIASGNRRELNLVQFLSGG